MVPKSEGFFDYLYRNRIDKVAKIDLQMYTSVVHITIVH